LSNKEKIIFDFLRGKGKVFLSFFRRFDDYSNTIVLDVPISKVGKQAGNGLTSKRQLSYLEGELKKKYGVNVIVLFRQSEFEFYEGTLKKLLENMYPDSIEWLYLSNSVENSIQVWVCLSDENSKEKSLQIKSQIYKILKIFKLGLINIDFLISDKPEPSIAAILRSIKILEPVNLGQIKDYLENKEYRALDDDSWLLKKLDTARKKGLILRDPTKGYYMLTSTGLDVVPFSRSKNSSDIERILLLSKRKKW
jgi:hypothetical protein